MERWHFIPWTLQYLVSGLAIVILSSFIFFRNRKSLAYQSFFLYALCTTAWLITAFFHRNAPSEALSASFFTGDLFFVVISWAFLPLTILCIWREKKSNFWLVLPPLFVGIHVLLTSPFDINWTKFGWSYTFDPGFQKVFYVLLITYSFLFFGAFALLVKKTTSRTMAKKYLFVFIGYVAFQGIGMTITTFFIQKNPDLPPFGGILNLFQFLFIAYAVSLKPEAIMSSSETLEPVHKLSELYLNFLNRFYTILPGKELGESSFKFRDYLEAMGLEDMMTYDSGSLVFKANRLTEEMITDVPDRILRVLKVIPRTGEVASELATIIRKTYNTLESQSEEKAKDWLENLLQKHGGFLTKHGMLLLPEKAPIPTILKRLTPGQSMLFKEDTPVGAYRLMKEAEYYGLECLSITKLLPQIIEKRYGLEHTAIQPISFEKTDGMMNPTDTHALIKAVEGFASKPAGTLILIDCFDQIKFANGFEVSMGLLETIRKTTVKNRSILCLTIPAQVFEAEELEEIEKEMEDGGTG